MYAKKRESSSGEEVCPSSAGDDTGELYLLKWFPTPHHYLPCPAVRTCPCDKLLRECSGSVTNSGASARVAARYEC